MGGQQGSSRAHRTDHLRCGVFPLLWIGIVADLAQYDQIKTAGRDLFGEGSASNSHVFQSCTSLLSAKYRCWRNRWPEPHRRDQPIVPSIHRPNSRARTLEDTDDGSERPKSLYSVAARMNYSRSSRDRSPADTSLQRTRQLMSRSSCWKEDLEGAPRWLQ